MLDYRGYVFFEGEIPNMLIAIVSLRFPLQIRAGYELAESYTQ